MPLGKLGRKTIFGYTFLMPKRHEYEEALRYVAVLLEYDQSDLELWEQATQHKMQFGPRRVKSIRIEGSDDTENGSEESSD